MLFEMTNFEFSVIRREVAPISVVIPTRLRPPHVIQEKLAWRLRSKTFNPFDRRKSLTLLSFSLISSESAIVSPQELPGNNAPAYRVGEALASPFERATKVAPTLTKNFLCFLSSRIHFGISIAVFGNTPTLER